MMPLGVGKDMSPDNNEIICFGLEGDVLVKTCSTRARGHTIIDFETNLVMVIKLASIGLVFLGCVTTVLVIFNAHIINFKTYDGHCDSCLPYK